MMKKVTVKAHSRRTKSGKVSRVKTHVTTKKGSSMGGREELEAMKAEGRKHTPSESYDDFYVDVINSARKNGPVHDFSHLKAEHFAKKYPVNHKRFFNYFMND